MLESTIEKKVCDYAKKRGFYVRKFTSPQQRGVPDRLFINPYGVVFFIEFKAPGKKPTKLQQHEHDLLCANGVQVFVVDNIHMGERIMDVAVMALSPHHMNGVYDTFGAGLV